MRFLYPLGTRRFAIPSHVNSSASPHVVTDMGSVPTGRVEVYVYRNGSIRRTKNGVDFEDKIFLYFPLYRLPKGYKNGTENPLGIPVYIGYTTLFTRV